MRYSRIMQSPQSHEQFAFQNPNPNAVVRLLRNLSPSSFVSVGRIHRSSVRQTPRRKRPVKTQICASLGIRSTAAILAATTLGVTNVSPSEAITSPTPPSIQRVYKSKSISETGSSCAIITHAVRDLSPALQRLEFRRPTLSGPVDSAATGPLPMVSAKVTGVAKDPIHDYSMPQTTRDSSPSSPPSSSQAHGSASTPHSVAAYLSSSSTNPKARSQQASQFALSYNVARLAGEDDDEARREFMLGARLVTAVMMGVMLGVERRATKLYLGVRSVTVLSVTAALVTVVVSTLVTSASIYKQTSLSIPSTPSVPVLRAVGTPCIVGISVAALTSVAVYATAKAVARTRGRLAPMSAAVGTAVGMGIASGAGQPLLTAVFYLAGVAVMRASSPSLKSSRKSSRAYHPSAHERLRNTRSSSDSRP